MLHRVLKCRKSVVSQVVIDTRDINKLTPFIYNLRRYMDYVKHIKEEDSPLFSLMFDEYFTPTQISKNISIYMSSIGVQNTSGHRLSKGAATGF